MAIFTDVFEDVTKQGRKIPTSDYHETGIYPIIDQGQSEIAGFTDETDGLFTDVPAIIFGDHTRVLKYVDTPCFLGADGVKLLKARIPNPNYKYLYYALSSADIPNTGYNRHFKWLKAVDIPLLDADEQQTIVDVLDKISELITLRKEQLAKLDQLVKSRFVELLQPYFDKGETQPLIGLVCEDRPITYGILKPGTNREGGYPVIRVKDFSRGLVSVEEVLHTTPEIYNKYLRSVLAEGDIIISIGGTIGRIAIVPKEFVGANITQHTARIALKDKRYLLYFRGLLESDIMQRWMKDRVLGVAQPSINLGDVKQMPIPIVDECAIKELNAFVEQTDKSKLAIQQGLDKLETLKKSLMQEYFG